MTSLCGVSIGIVFLENYSDSVDVGAADAEGEILEQIAHAEKKV